ncbi:hypothetical protein ABID25_006141 [Mesorhizobium abyssinicae]
MSVATTSPRMPAQACRVAQSYLKPRKLSIAMTMTTAPTSQMMLFMTRSFARNGCWSDNISDS